MSQLNTYTCNEPKLTRTRKSAFCRRAIATKRTRQINERTYHATLPNVYRWRICRLVIGRVVRQLQPLFRKRLLPDCPERGGGCRPGRPGRAPGIIRRTMVDTDTHRTQTAPAETAGTERPPCEETGPN